MGVAGYGVYLNGAPAGETPSQNFTLTGLNCGVTYTVSVDAYDAAGNRSPQASTTASTSPCSTPDTTAPTAPTGLAGIANTGSTISVSWNASSDNVAVAGYRIYRNGVNAGTTTDPSYTVSGLACDTDYIIGVAAFDAAGNQSPSATKITSTAACPAPDTTPPATPSGLAAGATTATTVSLTWNASTDNVGVTGYGVYNGTTLVATSPSTSFTVAGLTCGSGYNFAVDVFDAAGNRSGRATLSAATAACAVPDTTSPSAPPNLARVGSTTTSITLSWNASTDNVGVVGYSTYRNGTAVSTTTSLSWIFTSLVCGTTYAFEVEGYDAAGNRSPRSTISTSTNACPDTTPPSAPTGLTRTAATETSITLGWNASTDDVGVTGYSTFRNGSAVAPTAATSYTFTGLACGTSYTLGVGAYDAANNSSTRSNLNATTAACTDTTTPTAPTALTKSAATATSITLSWTASTDNVGVTGYTAYRGTVSQGTTTTTSFTLTGLACGTAYTLGVEAFDASGNRSTRSTLSASTAACADTTAPSAPTGLTRSSATTTSITLAWTASTDNVGVTGYSRYLDGTLVSSGTGTSFAFTGLACGTTYTLGVEGYDAAGNRTSLSTLSAATSACQDSTAPSAPTALTRTAATAISITLSWTASTDNVGVTGYTAYSETTSQGTTTTTSYTFTGLACGTAYTLGVEAHDAAGNRSTRPTLSASTAACADTIGPVDADRPPAECCHDDVDHVELERVDRQRRRDRVLGLPRRHRGCDDHWPVVHVHRACLRRHVHPRRRGLRCSRQPLGAEHALGRNGGVPRHDRSLGADRADPERRDDDVDHARLDGVDGRRHSHRLQPVPERHARLERHRHLVRLHGPRLRNDISTWRGGLRRSRQPVRPQHAVRRHRCLPGHDGSVRTHGSDAKLGDSDLDHADLDGLDRQRRRRGLHRVPRHGEPGRHDGGGDHVHVHRPRLRHRLHARRRSVRRRREPLYEADFERFDGPLSGLHCAVRADRPPTEHGDGDLDHARLDGLDGQRRRDRLLDVP